ncbi:MAG: glutaminyl-peptide cyclotransferase [Microthrixaceae bacterium]
MRVVFLVLSVLIAVATLGGAAWLFLAGGDKPTEGACRPKTPEALVANVVSEVPHDPDAFTQGLDIDDEGRLWESTGLRGESQVRLLDTDTGELLASSDLSEDLFGEGLTTTAAGELLQLTWTSGEALLWRPGEASEDPPSEEGTLEYRGEGWGITTLDDDYYAMSDGSARLQFKDPEDFATAGVMEVERKGGEADRLNELEWDGTSLWANRFQSDEILRIDLDCGVVDGVVDASNLVTSVSQQIQAAGLERDLVSRDVLNGIAWLGPDSPDRYYVTGKRWPVMYEVSFEPA